MAQKKSENSHQTQQNRTITKEAPVSEDLFQKHCRDLGEDLASKAPSELSKEVKMAFRAMQNGDPIGLAQALALIINKYQNSLGSHHDIGQIQKHEADAFAKKMEPYLEKVRNEGYTSVRKIAKRFNELGIPSFKGKEWSYGTVHDLIQRRRGLGLE